MTAERVRKPWLIGSKDAYSEGGRGRALGILKRTGIKVQKYWGKKRDGAKKHNSVSNENLTFNKRR